MLVKRHKGVETEKGRQFCHHLEWISEKGIGKPGGEGLTG